MTTYEVGQTAVVRLRVTSDGTALANLGGGVPTLTITKPDGLTTAGSAVLASTGLYDGSYALANAGRHRFTFTGSGANSGGLPYTEVVDAWPADPRFIISVADVKAELNHISDVNDDELRLYIAATTPVVENIVGSVLVRSVTQTLDGGKRAVLLDDAASAITSVTVNGSPVQYVANLESGIVYSGTQGMPSYFDYGHQNVVVTYTVGNAIIDPNVILAARIIAAHQYGVGQQGRGGRGRSGARDDLVMLSTGVAIPTRAYELLQPSAQNNMPGMA